MTQEKTNDFQMMTIKEISAYLKIPVNTLYKNYKKLPYLKFNHKIMFCKYKVNEWIEKEMEKNRN